MDTQDQTKTTIPSGHVCRRCGWTFPNSHPSSKNRRAHKRICGTIEGYTKVIDSEAVSDDEQHSDDDIEITPTPKIEKKFTEERSTKSEEDLFSDAVTEFSDGGFSTPSAEERFFDTTKLLYSPIQLIKGDDNHEIFQTPDTEDRNGSHKDRLVDDVASSKTDNKDQEEEAEYVLSVPSDIPLVDQAETLLQDFKDHKNAEDLSSEDTFEVKITEDKIEESQTCKNVDNGDPVLTEEYSREIEKEPEIVIEFQQKIVESVGGDSKESGSSSRNSLDANWGSVSVLSTTSIDAENAHSIIKSEISSDKSRLGKSDAFEEGPSLGPTKEESVNQNNSEVNAVKVTMEEFQPPNSEGIIVGNETEGRKRNLDAIEKVTNWSTSENVTNVPLKNVLSEAKPSSPKVLKIRKDEVDEKISEPVKSNLVNHESSPPKYIGEGKKVRKKAKGRGSWIPFACCSSINVG
ncbi:hypothetical protein LXL04_014518 [Taraxacum kok-saghyz]